MSYISTIIKKYTEDRKIFNNVIKRKILQKRLDDNNKKLCNLLDKDLTDETKPGFYENNILACNISFLQVLNSIQLNKYEYDDLISGISKLKNLTIKDNQDCKMISKMISKTLYSFTELIYRNNKSILDGYKIEKVYYQFVKYQVERDYTNLIKNNSLSAEQRNKLDNNFSQIINFYDTKIKLIESKIKEFFDLLDPKYVESINNNKKLEKEKYSFFDKYKEINKKIINLYCRQSELTALNNIEIPKRMNSNINKIKKNNKITSKERSQFIEDEKKHCEDEINKNKEELDSIDNEINLLEPIYFEYNNISKIDDAVIKKNFFSNPNLTLEFQDNYNSIKSKKTKSSKSNSSKSSNNLGDSIELYESDDEENENLNIIKDESLKLMDIRLYQNQQTITEEELKEFTEVVLPKRQSLISTIDFDKVQINMDLITNSIQNYLIENGLSDIIVKSKFNEYTQDMIIISFYSENIQNFDNNYIDSFAHFTFHKGLGAKADPVGPYHFKIDDDSRRYSNLELNKTDKTVFADKVEQFKDEPVILTLIDGIVYVLNENIILFSN